MHAFIVRALVIIAPLLACAPKQHEPEAPPPRVCTDMGCMNGLHLQMTKPTTLQPNGPQCEPTCRSASAPVAVP